jgi:DNA-binding GntR family transcriptional regulator
MKQSSTTGTAAPRKPVTKDGGLSSVSLEKPPSLAALVAQHIKEAIVDARLQLGEALSEDKIAAALQVSRTPVREALSMLQKQGLIDILPKTGSFVFLPSIDDIAELADYRAMLELRAFEMALERAPEGWLKELKTAVAVMSKAGAAQDPIAYARADDRFHSSAFNHCQNRYLLDAYNGVAGRIAALRCHLAGPLKLYQSKTFEEHMEIVDAVARRDATGLRMLVQNHIDVMRKNYIRALEEGALQVPQSRPRSKGPKGSNARKGTALNVGEPSLL